MADFGYVIPSEFAERMRQEWLKGFLDRINDGVDNPDEDGVE